MLEGYSLHLDLLQKACTLKLVYSPFYNVVGVVPTICSRSRTHPPREELMVRHVVQLAAKQFRI